MYKNIKKKKISKKTKETSDTIHTQKQKKTTEIAALCSSIKKIEMLKENSYLFTNRIHKKKDR
jgi:hypothetical protein